MTLYAAIEPAEDLELYLSYSRPAGRYAAFADIKRRLASVAPHFDFDREMTQSHNRIVSVRDAADQSVRAMAVMTDNRTLRLYYADDTASTQCLMQFIDGEKSHGQPAPNS